MKTFVKILLMQMFLLPAVLSAATYSELDNGTVHVKLELSSGGGISYISASGSNYNLVNIHDKGRYIQQSYYAGQTIDRISEGQSPSWSPWNWNPVQAGDAGLNVSPVLSHTNSGSQIYIKVRPLLWDMTTGEQAQADMEQWVTLENNVVHVTNKLTCFRTDNRWIVKACHQELPAVYTIGDLNHLYTYEGASPWTKAGLTEKYNSGPPWVYWNTSEHWAAYVNDSSWGLGVYNPQATLFVGGFCLCGAASRAGGPNDNPTGYISPLLTESFDKNTVFQYSYDLILGDINQIRNYVYYKEGRVTPTPAPTQAVTREWYYTGGTEGWTLTNGLSGSVAGSVYTLNITAADPYMLSGNSLNIDAGTYKYIRVRLRNTSAGANAQFFWITNADTSWNAAKSITFGVNANDAGYSEYVVNLSAVSAWSGTIKQLRFDPAGTSGQVLLDYIKVDLGPGIEPGKVYTVSAKNSGKCASVQNDGTANGDRFVQSACAAKNSQRLMVTDEGDNYYRFTVQHSGKVMDVSLSSPDDVHQWTWGGGDNQKWKIDGTDSPGFYRLSAKHNGKVLDVTGNSTADNALLHGWDWLNADNQKWAFTESMATPTPYIPAGASPRLSIYSDTWAATDAMGRSLPGHSVAGDERPGKYVGMFYFLWQGYHGATNIYDITQMIAANPASPAYGPIGAFHWWGKPEADYFRAGDPWVIRRNMAMLANAGVDVIFFDVTNAVTYLDTVDKICAEIQYLRGKGVPAPYISFITNSNPVATIADLYNNFYKPGKYSDVWFRWENKPLILGKSDAGHTVEIVNFFTWRYSWAWTNTPAEPNHWQWIDTFPQDYGRNDLWQVEEIPVSVASHPVNNIGNSCLNGVEPARDQYKLTAYTGQGRQFSQQWTRAHEVDPAFVFVDGWNEWVAQRFVRENNGPPGEFLGEYLPNGGTFFVDCYNQEYMRDIEPMDGGHTDNFYYQLVAEVRKHKGVRQQAAASAPKTISIDGIYSEWASTAPVFKDIEGDTLHRNYARYDGSVNLVNTTGRNDIVESRVSCDGQNIYFYVKTAAAMTAYTGPNWMLLFIDAEKNHATGWEGYDYVVNGGVVSASKTSLKSWNGSSWQNVSSDIDYAASGSQLEIKVPRNLIGETSAPVGFYFHIADNVQSLNDIKQFFVSGDSAPDRRFNYEYNNVCPVTTPTSTVVPSKTRTPSVTRTATLTVSSTASRVPSATSTMTHTRTSSVTSTASPTMTSSRTGSPTMTSSRTGSPTMTITITSYSTFTQTRTGSPTMSATASVSPTFTNTRTPAITITNTPLLTSTPTYSVTRTPSPVPSATATASSTFQVPSSTFTITPSVTPTFTLTKPQTLNPTPSLTMTITITSYITFTRTNSPTLTLTQISSPTPTYTLTAVPTAAEFSLEDVYVYPNPAAAGKGMQVHFNSGRECVKTQVNIYSAGFRLVRSISRETGLPAGENTLKIEGFEINSLGSGMYYYVLSAEDRQAGKARAKAGVLIILP